MKLCLRWRRGYCSCKNTHHGPHTSRHVGCGVVASFVYSHRAIN